MKKVTKAALCLLLIWSLLICCSGCSSTQSRSAPINSPSVVQWLRDRFVPGLNTVTTAKDNRTWTGWIFDRDCIGINPAKHTKACNLMGSCYLSGLGIIPYIPGKSFDTYTAKENFVVFDGNSRSIARAFLQSLPADWVNNITIKVTGYPVNNIPTNADESVVPEDDSSKVDHYLSGIHITRIEAAYIDGVSTNKLPSPNAVYPKS